MFSLRPGPQIRNEEHLGVWFRPESPISLRKAHSWAIIIYFWYCTCISTFVTHITESVPAVECDTVTTRPFTSTDIFLFWRESFIFLSEVKSVTFCCAVTSWYTSNYYFLSFKLHCQAVPWSALWLHKTSGSFESTDSEEVHLNIKIVIIYSCLRRPEPVQWNTKGRNSGLRLH